VRGSSKTIAEFGLNYKTDYAGAEEYEVVFGNAHFRIGLALPPSRSTAGVRTAFLAGDQKDR
jgi:hypothetical protein